MKLTVSQTSGGFLRMRAGGVYYYFWSALLMSIIYCFGSQTQHLQENERNVAHRLQNIYLYICKIYTCTSCVERDGRWQKPPSVHLSS